jgi:N-acetyl sugar amidotransferase
MSEDLQMNPSSIHSTHPRSCSLTVLDDSIPGIEFDEEGVSNFVRQAQWRLQNEVFRGDQGRRRLEEWIQKIKNDGHGHQYDCIIGLSGGVDSSYVAIKVIEHGLRPLAIHLDNGWNNEVAVGNIERIVRKLNIDLYTHVVDWAEIRDLQRSYIKASLLDLECVSDHAINTILFGLARKFGIRHVIHGGNVATESILPRAWGYDKRDGVNVRAVHRRFGTVPLKTYPSMSPAQLFYYLFVRKISAFPILNYLDFNKTKAVEELKNQLGWVPYPRKHGENRFTRFFQELYLPRKFGIDKRRAHLSSLIVAGEITREDAVLELKKPLYSADDESDEIEFVAKKLKFSTAELIGLIDAPPNRHQDYPNVAWMFNQSSGFVQIARYVAKGEFRFNRLREIWSAGKRAKA